MTKEEYVAYRASEYRQHYKMHSSARNELRICTTMELGELPHPNKKSDTSWMQTLMMLLTCCFTEDEIDAELTRLFPALSNRNRTRRIIQIFTNNKCKNVTVFRNEGITGLKWDRFQIFDREGNWRG